MTIKEENQTKRWIAEALFELIGTKDYQDITISQIVNKAGLGRRTFYRYFSTKDKVIEYMTESLMDEFAQNIISQQAETQEAITEAYFEFWEKHIDTLLLLEKAHLLYFIEDNLYPLIFRVAVKSGHLADEAEIAEMDGESQYALAMKLAGFWKATKIWAAENQRRSPKEMSRIINAVLK